MNIYEVVNYYSDEPEGLEAREVLGRWLERDSARNHLIKLAFDFAVTLEDWEDSFETALKGGLVSDYYALEEHETDG